jgi:hypothetical protein
MPKKAGSGSISQRHGSAVPDPDPLQNVMDPEQCFFLTLEAKSKIRNCNLLIPRPPKRTSKLQEKPSARIREHPALQNIKFLFSIFLGQLCPPGSGSFDLIESGSTLKCDRDPDLDLHGSALVWLLRSWSALGYKVGSGCALKPMRIHNTSKTCISIF